MKRFVALLLAVLLSLACTVVGLASDSHDSDRNLRYTQKLVYKASSYIGMDIFNNVSYSSSFWSQYSSYFTDDKYFHITLIFDKDMGLYFGSLVLFSSFDEIGINRVCSSYIDDCLECGSYYTSYYGVSSPDPFTLKFRFLPDGSVLPEKVNFNPNPLFRQGHNSSYFNDVVTAHHSSKWGYASTQFWKYLCNYDLVVMAEITTNKFITTEQKASRGFYPYTGGFEEPSPSTGTSVKITHPENGGYAEGIRATAFKFTTTLPNDANVDKATVEIKGFEKYELYSKDSVVSSDGKFVDVNYHYIGTMPWNIATDLQVTLTDSAGKTYTDMVTYTCYDKGQVPDPPPDVEGDEPFIKITHPENGGSVDKLRATKLKFTAHLPNDENLSGYTFAVDGAQEAKLSSKNLFISSDKKWANIDFEYYVTLPWDTPTKLTATAKNEGIDKSYSDHIIYTCFSGSGGSGGGGSGGTGGEGGLPSIGSFEDLINSIVGWTSGLASMFGKFFSFLPPEVNGLIILSFAVCLVMRLAGR